MIRSAFIFALSIFLASWLRAVDRFDPEAVTSSRALFYGIALDQYGVPVPGAMAQIKVRKGGFWTGHRQETVEVAVDPDGRFMYDGPRANQLHVAVGKDGYEAGSFTAVLSPLESEAERYFPDKDHPYPLILWKNGPVQPIIDYKREYRILCDPQTPLRLNVETGRWVRAQDPAHLEIRMMCPADLRTWLREGRIGWQGDVMKWTLTMAPIGGKICYKGGIDLSAPYQRPGVLVSMLTLDVVKEDTFRDASSNGWKVMFSADHGKVYGRLSVEIDWGIPPREEADWAKREPWLRVWVCGSVNASGSPDLTPDPARTTTFDGRVTYGFDPKKGYVEMPQDGGSTGGP